MRLLKQLRQTIKDFNEWQTTKKEMEEKILCTFIPLKDKPYHKLCTVHESTIKHKGNTYLILREHKPIYKENIPQAYNICQ